MTSCCGSWSAPTAIAHIPRILYHWRAHATLDRRRRRRPSRTPISPSRARSPSICGAAASTPRSSSASSPGLHRIVHRVSPVDQRRSRARRRERARPRRGRRLVADPAPPELERRARRPRRDARRTPSTALTAAGIPDARITIGPTSPGDDPPPHWPTPPRPPPPSTSCSCRPPPSASPTTGSPACSATATNRASPPPDPSSSPPTDASNKPASPSPKASPSTSITAPVRRPRLPVVYNVSAVSGVLATRRDTYHQLGGLDPQLQRPRAHRLLPTRHRRTTSASSSSPTPACAPPAPTPPPTTSPPSGAYAKPGPKPTPTTPTTTPTTAPTAATSSSVAMTDRVGRRRTERTTERHGLAYQLHHRRPKHRHRQREGDPGGEPLIGMRAQRSQATVVSQHGFGDIGKSSRGWRPADAHRGPAARCRWSVP